MHRNTLIISKLKNITNAFIARTSVSIIRIFFPMSIFLKTPFSWIQYFIPKKCPDSLVNVTQLDTWAKSNMTISSKDFPQSSMCSSMLNKTRTSLYCYYPLIRLKEETMIKMPFVTFLFVLSISKSPSTSPNMITCK